MAGIVRNVVLILVLCTNLLVISCGVAQETTESIIPTSTHLVDTETAATASKSSVQAQVGVLARNDSLGVLNETSTRGFSFNCLTSYSDSEKMRDDLFYANPCTIFDYCKRNFSKQVALLHDYGLYEFTILVRKET